MVGVTGGSEGRKVAEKAVRQGWRCWGPAGLGGREPGHRERLWGSHWALSGQAWKFRGDSTPGNHRGAKAALGRTS